MHESEDILAGEAQCSLYADYQVGKPKSILFGSANDVSTVQLHQVVVFEREYLRRPLEKGETIYETEQLGLNGKAGAFAFKCACYGMSSKKLNIIFVLMS